MYQVLTPSSFFSRSLKNFCLNPTLVIHSSQSFNKMRCTQALLFLSALLPGALAAKFNKRADTDSFKLYAYGDNIGGLPVFYYQGSAYIGDINNITGTIAEGAVPVTFSNNGGVWTVTPDNSTTQFSNATFYVPGPNEGGGPGGFLNGTAPNTTDSITSSGWSFYGTVAILELADGSWATNFYAGQSNFTGVYTLDWNVTDTTSDIPVTIKTVAPSNPSS